MYLDPIDFLFLVPLFAIGLICSYTDIKYGKILNKVIILGFLCGFFLYLILFFYNLFFLHQKQNFYYLSEVALNSLISFFICYFLWYFKLWSAGDAKLFTLYTFLMPLKFYSKSYVLYFPSFALLINLFIPLFFVLTANAFLTEAKEICKLRQKLKEFRNLDFKIVFKKLKLLSSWFLAMYLNYVFIYILVRLLSNFLKNFSVSKILSNPFFLYFLLLLIMKSFMSIKTKKKWLGFFINGIVIIYCSLLVFWGKTQFLQNMLKTALVLMVLIGFTRQILDFYIKKKETKRVKIRDLKEGMIVLPNGISLILEKLKTKEEKESFSWIDGGGLNSDQIKIIKNLFNNDSQSSVEIYKTLPFAPFMFLAAIILVLTQGSFLIAIDSLFKVLLK